MFSSIGRFFSDYAGVLGPVRQAAALVIVVAVAVLCAVAIILKEASLPDRAFAPFPSFAWLLDIAAVLGPFLLVGIWTALFTRLLGGMGMFKNAISDVLGEDRWLDRRSDLDDLWRRITRRVFMPGFKEDAPGADELLRELNKAMTNVVDNPTRRVRYYGRNACQRIDIRWLDETRSKVCIEEFYECEIVPFDTSESVVFECVVTPVTGDALEDYEITLVDLSVDGQSLGSQATDGRLRRSVNEASQTVRVEADLVGSPSYTVIRRMRYVQSIAKDPVLVFSPNRIIWGMNVIFTSQDATLRMTFEELGMNGILRRVRDEGGRVLERDTRSVLLPDQGYVLVMTAAT